MKRMNEYDCMIWQQQQKWIGKHWKIVQQQWICYINKNRAHFHWNKLFSNQIHFFLIKLLKKKEYFCYNFSKRATRWIVQQAQIQQTFFRKNRIYFQRNLSKYLWYCYNELGKKTLTQKHSRGYSQWCIVVYVKYLTPRIIKIAMTI